MTRSLLLLLLLALPAMAAPARGPAGEVPPWLAYDEDPQELLAGIAAVGAGITEGNRPAALAAADAFLERRPGHPLPLVMKARALREWLLEQDWITDGIKADAEPIHALLDEAIAVCDAAEEAGEAGPVGDFYRGWAWMFKGQLHAIATSNYAAGRSAAKGHGYFERYLEVQPYDPDARGFMGIYQYYAASLPALAKFFSKLLFIPGGNEAKGLANMRFACVKDGPFRTDHRVVRASTFTFFAGRLEEALPRYREILDRHPRYIRLAEPLVVLALVHPARSGELRELAERTVLEHVRGLEGAADWATIRRMSFYESLADLFFESPAAAVEGLERVVALELPRPDWMDPFARLNLAGLLACSGEGERARALLEDLAERTEQDSIRRAARECLADPATWSNRDLEADFGFVADIRAGRYAAARQGLELYGARRGSNLVHGFYAAELALGTGDLEGAARHLEAVLAGETPAGQGLLRTLATVRLAEIRGTQGDYEAAARGFERALDERLNEPMFKLIFKGRKRYYEKLEEAGFTGKPSLIAGPGSGG